MVTNIRDPFSFADITTGGSPNVRSPLTFAGSLTGGQPDLRAALVLAEPITGGNPKIRANYLFAEPMTGGNPNLRIALTWIEALIPVPPELPVATLVFPPLSPRNRGWDRTKTPGFNTAVRQSTSGRRSATPFMQYPVWSFELNYPYLPDVDHAVTQARDTDLRTLTGFFKDCKGRGVAFLYQDADDHQAIGAAIATADGVTLQWPFAAQIWGASEPVGQVDLSALASFSSTAVDPATDQITIPGHGFVTAQYPPMFIANTGGALPTPLAASTPYWPIVVDANTIKLATTSANASGGTAIDITAAGAGTDALSKGYAIYDNGTIVNPGSASLTLPNQVVFGSAPTSSHAITADFDFYFVCRFKDDAAEFKQFASKLWDLEKIAFDSEPTG